MALDPQKRVRGPLLQNSRGSAETSPISTEPGLGTRSPQPQSPRSLEAGPPQGREGLPPLTEPPGAHALTPTESRRGLHRWLGLAVISAFASQVCFEREHSREAW